MKKTTRVLMPTATYTCIVCGHEWTPRKPGKPKRCANCKTPHWEEGDSAYQIGNAMTSIRMGLEKMEQAISLIDSAMTELEKATGVEVA